MRFAHLLLVPALLLTTIGSAGANGFRYQYTGRSRQVSKPDSRGTTYYTVDNGRHYSVDQIDRLVAAGVVSRMDFSGLRSAPAAAPAPANPTGRFTYTGRSRQVAKQVYGPRGDFRGELVHIVDNGRGYSLAEIARFVEAGAASRMDFVGLPQR